MSVAKCPSGPAGLVAGGMLLLLGVPGSLPGQVPEAAEDTVPVERPFVTGGQWDKPYLADVAGRVAIGGYAETHARYQRVDGLTEELGFVVKRFNLFAASDVSDLIRFGVELEFEDGAEEILLEFATIDFRVHPSLSLRAGMILSPLGRFNLAHDSPINEFTDRPLVATELLGVALSEPGIGVFGRIPLGSGAGRLTYEAYAVNGFDAGVVEDSPEGVRIPAGRRNFEDANRSPALVGRIAASPALGWEVGVSGHHGAWNRFEADGLELDQRRNLTIWVLDLEAAPAGFRIQGEAAAARIDLPPGLAGLYQSRQRGFFVEAVREIGRGWVPTLPASVFGAGLRLEAVDFDSDTPGDSMRQLSLGLNFRPAPGTVFKLDYVRGRSFDIFTTPTEHAALLFSVATYF